MTRFEELNEIIENMERNASNNKDISIMKINSYFDGQYDTLEKLRREIGRIIQRNEMSNIKSNNREDL